MKNSYRRVRAIKKHCAKKPSEKKVRSKKKSNIEQINPSRVKNNENVYQTCGCTSALKPNGEIPSDKEVSRKLDNFDNGTRWYSLF